MLLDIEPWSGTVERLDYSESDEAITWSRTQTITPFLDEAASARDCQYQRWRGEDNTFWRVATIPNTVIEAWMQEGVSIFDKNAWPEIRRRLNGDYKYLKTAPVTI